MNELSPELKKLMQAARESYSPNTERVSAVRDSLAARIAAPAGGSETVAATSNAPAASGMVSTAAAWSKPIAIALIATLGAGALWLGTRAPAPAVAPQHAPAVAPQSSPSQAPAQPPVAANEPQLAPHAAALPAPNARAAGQTRPALAPSSAQRVPPSHEHARVTAVEDAPSPAPRRERSGGSALPRKPTGAAPVRSGAPIEPVAASGAATASVAARGEPDAAEPAASVDAEPAATVQPPVDEPAAAPADDSLVDELALLRRARAALARKQPEKALALAKEHASRYPHGTLRQERLATQVLALCALQRTEDARLLTRELERVAPRSPHLMRLRASCVTEGVLGEDR